eukprot:CAMPEP_0203670310 /NCGR_PEP_ID=MMETSP0090-20130426/6422_1 /ASSEMBLY_ACC=CAM_ASM_001088 /TAXON_ID=426623 /ORGANISM="Chaetoceros affinis, Strain CCMP159" /LENGTH=252 /DNA_ID=CAMNT_0050535139 /DNA_START=107 /DNA_END=865 /DNA_ORIENTATION=+
MFPRTLGGNEDNVGLKRQRPNDYAEAQHHEYSHQHEYQQLKQKQERRRALSADTISTIVDHCNIDSNSYNNSYNSYYNSYSSLPLPQTLYSPPQQPQSLPHLQSQYPHAACHSFEQTNTIPGQPTPLEEMEELTHRSQLQRQGRRGCQRRHAIVGTNSAQVQVLGDYSFLDDNDDGDGDEDLLSSSPSQTVVSASTSASMPVAVSTSAPSPYTSLPMMNADSLEMNHRPNKVRRVSSSIFNPEGWSRHGHDN